MGYLFLIIIVYIGWRISGLIKLESDYIYFRILSGPVFGIIFSTIFLYSLQYLLHLFLSYDTSLIISIIALVLICLYLIIWKSNSHGYLSTINIENWFYGFKGLKPFITTHSFVLISICIGLIISAPIFLSSLYVHSDQLIMKGSMWSDITLHLGLASSFSSGENIHTEQITYPGTFISYHFLFHYFVGVVSFLGAESYRIFILISIINFVQLSLITYLFGKKIFSSETSGLLSFVFFCFGSSTAFFVIFIAGIENGNLVSTFANHSGWLSNTYFENWGLFNFNVYVNQLHFPFAITTFAIVTYLLSAITFYERSDGNKVNYLIISLTIGSIPFFHIISCISLCIILVMFFFLSRRNRKEIFVSGLITMVLIAPQIYLWKFGNDSLLTGYPKIHFGYEIGRLDIIDISLYYLKIFGIKIILALLSLYFLSNKERILFVIFLPLFILPNVLQFGYVLYDNNKFLILWLFIINLYASFCVLKIWNINLFSKFLTIILIFSCIATGLVDYRGMLKHHTSALPYKNDSLRNWIEKNTDPDSIFLTDSTTYHSYRTYFSVLQSGRKVFVNDISGSTQNLDSRKAVLKETFESDSIKDFCNNLMKNNIDYVIVEEEINKPNYFRFNTKFFLDNFTPVFRGNDLYVFSYSSNCTKP